MSDRKKETEVIGEGNRISRYSESFVAFLVSAYSLLSLYFFYNSREDLQEKVLLLDSGIRCFCIGYANDIVNTDVIKIRKFY